MTELIDAHRRAGIEARFDGKLEIVEPGGCWIWVASCNMDGYGEFSVGGKMRRAHRIAWELYRGPIPDGLCVLHRCDNPPCVRPDHLFLGTHAENMADRDRKNRRTPPRGEQHGRAKLTKIDVAHIRELGLRLSKPDLAKRYDVHRTTIYDILNGRSWR